MNVLGPLGQGLVEVTVTKHRNFVMVNNKDLKFGIWVHCIEATFLVKVNSRLVFLKIETF